MENYKKKTVKVYYMHTCIYICIHRYIYRYIDLYEIYFASCTIVEYESFASDSLVVEAKKLAALFPPANKEAIEKLCTEISNLAQELESCQDVAEVSTVVMQQ